MITIGMMTTKMESWMSMIYVNSGSGWESTAMTDYDGDGCRDETEDLDDDNEESRVL
ncbi:MAG: hypothetical protein Ct9H90mP14_0950 [Methanobacteriota archaeon]|nr:MAG: hypothetical protein Ct9H90mP14_0950 [Euryarchaeota archaeon]